MATGEILVKIVAREVDNDKRVSESASGRIGKTANQQVCKVGKQTADRRRAMVERVPVPLIVLFQ
jgi:hypothetical protein